MLFDKCWTLLDKHIQHSAKQNSFTALRDWTSLPSGPSHDSTTWLDCLLNYWLCVSLRLCFYLYCCFMFECSGKGVLLAKLGLPFLMCQLELVHVPVCDFFVCVCVCINFRICIWESGKCFLVCLVEVVFICLYLYLYILEEESFLPKWKCLS